MKMKFFKTALLLIIIFIGTDAFAKSKVIPAKGRFESRFLIVVDNETFAAVKTDVIAYKVQLESEGLGTMILVGEWNDPMVLRNEIRAIYNKKPVLEGAVFIGNVPIVRVRNFQHATTAFKMDEEKFPMFESSVTSDRFYDDLDLEFEFISKDEKYPGLFYYKLKETSPQVVESDFYSARMLPPSDMGVDKNQLLSRYLKKVVAAHKENNPLDKFVVFNGHGYNSDCLTAWQNEQFYMREVAPEAFKISTGNGFYNYRQDPFMKFRLFEKMQQRGTDLFIFHEHGDFDTQYINGEFPAANTLEYKGDTDEVEFTSDGVSMDKIGPMQALSVSLRNLYRKYKGERRENFKKSVMEEMGITESFFDQKILDQTKVSDSAFNANYNIHLEDLIDIRMQPKLSIFDACYNGSFHRPGYIAGYHVFGNGATIVAQGNTVNVLQDKWSLELLGILGAGARVGFWQKEFQFIESHMIGDPTYMFRTEGSTSLNHNLAVNQKDPKVWEEYLKSSSPALNAIALKKLSRIYGDSFSDRLLSVLKSSPYYSVRMEALKRLIEICDKNIVEALKIGLDDPYELIRRNAARYAGYTGENALTASLVNTVLFSNESQRVQYAAQNSLLVMDPEAVLKEVEKQANTDHVKRNAEAIVKAFKADYKKQDKSMNIIMDNNAPDDSRISAIRNLRNNNIHRQVDGLLKVLSNPQEKELIRTTLAEALGWFEMSFRKTEIVDAMNLLVKDSSLPAGLKSEIEQSLIRLR